MNVKTWGRNNLWFVEWNDRP